MEEGIELGLRRDKEAERKFVGLRQSHDSLRAPGTGLARFQLPKDNFISWSRRDANADCSVSLSVEDRKHRQTDTHRDTFLRFHT